MTQVIASYQVSAFTTPTNATTADADQVRGNDNTVRAAINNHDGDSGIHFQSSTLAARPVAGTAGRKWMTSDDRRIWFDDGSSWQEAGYASNVSPTFTGTLTCGAIAASGNITLSGTFIHATGGLTLDNNGTLNPITITGGSTLTLTGTNGTVTVQALLGILRLAAASGNDIRLSTNGSDRWFVQGATGYLMPFTNITIDIGGVANQVRDIYATTLKCANVQVVAARQTGWTVATGTPTRTTFDTATVTLPQLAQRVKALIDDLAAHGLIGT